MSQEKVDRYKQQKANRKQIIKMEKRKRVLARFTASIIGLAFVALVGWSVYDKMNAQNADTQTEVDLSSIQNYLNEVTTQQ